MKIGIDVRLWNETGVGRYIRNLIKYLQILDKKNEYVLFCLGEDEEEIKFQISPIRQTQGKNFKFQIVQSNIRWHTLAEQLKFPQILQNEKLDLMHFPYFSVPLFYKGKFVVTIHDLIINHFDTGEASTMPLPLYQLKRIGYKYIVSQVITKADKIITVSNATKDEIISHYLINPQKIVVTYEGVDSRIQSSEFPLRLSQSRLGRSEAGEASRVQNKKKKDKQEYFLYVGNAYPHKNLNRLLEAFKILIQQNSEVQLIMVGKEDFFYKKLKKFANDLNISHRIVFKHDVNDEELSLLYQRAVALVSSSLMEGFGLPVLEAMAHECLVLASDIPVYREIAEDGAIYFDPTNVLNISETLIRALKKDDKIMAQKKKGLLLVKKFSWETLAQKTLEVYESCHRLRPG